jgi:protein-S-isoprenylcysteine O-methyltransferase Ste14
VGCNYSVKKGFTVDVSISQHHQLKNDGLYKNIRHPSYLGLVMQFLGLSLLFNSWLTLLIITIPVFLALANRIKIEEELLSSAFGEEYENYKSIQKGFSQEFFDYLSFIIK